MDWLTDFYQQADEKLDLQKALRGGYPLGDFNEIICRASKNRFPCFVPSFRTGQTVIYGLAADARSLDELRRIMSAALGSADTTPDLTVIYQPSHEGEKLLLERSPDGIIAFKLLPVNDSNAGQVKALREKRQERVYSTLKTLLDLYQQRPHLHSAAKRQTGRILRDFYTACQAKDGVAAGQFLDELRGNNRLSPLNLSFLELLALAAAEQWDAILAHPKLDSHLKGRVPLRIQRLLLRTCGHLNFNALQQAGFPVDALEPCRKIALHLLPLFRVKPPFGHVQGFRHDWQLWAIGAALTGYNGWKDASPLLPPVWTEALQQWVNGADFSFLSEEQLAHATPVIIVSADRAAELLKETLDAAPERELEIYSLLAVMPEATQQALRNMPKLWKTWQDLKAQCESQDYGWKAWLDEVMQAHEPGALELLGQQATASYQDWSPESFNEQQLLTLLEQGLSAEQGKLLRNTIPHFLNWIQTYDVTISSRIWLDWLTLLAIDDLLSEQDVRLGGMLLEAFLSGQFVAEEYEKALDAMGMICASNASVRSLSYTLDIAECLLDLPYASEVARLQFWMRLQAIYLSHWERLEANTQVAIRLLARLFVGHEGQDIFPVDRADSPVASPLNRDLCGCKVGIYSLTEPAARRGKDSLELLFPGIIVEINHDHVATPALENLARKSDFFILAANSAKHQASDAIKKLRDDVIYPMGKGASSMVTAFIQALV